MNKIKNKKISPKLSKFLYFILIAIICFFGIKVALVLISAPILAMYGAAYNFYSITGDASYFEHAAKMTQSWLINLVLLCSSILLYKIIKLKRDKPSDKSSK